MYSLTKNKPIYHVEDYNVVNLLKVLPIYVPSVINRFMFGDGVVIVCTMQSLLEKKKKKKKAKIPYFHS